MQFKVFYFSLSAVLMGVFCVFVTALTNQVKITSSRELWSQRLSSKLNFKVDFKIQSLSHVRLHLSLLPESKQAVITPCIKILVITTL